MGLSDKTKRWLKENCNISLNGKTVLVTGANSGVGFKTADGFDLVIGTNYIGTYYLSERVLPYLSSLPHKVVYVNTISSIHKITPPQNLL